MLFIILMPIVVSVVASGVIYYIYKKDDSGAYYRG